MYHPLESLCLAKGYQIHSIDETKGVTVQYFEKTFTIPYGEWKAIEQHVLSYFSFRMETATNQQES